MQFRTYSKPFFSYKSSSTGEMALLVEGLGIGGETSIEEYIIGPAEEFEGETADQKDKIKLYGPGEGLSWIAKPVTGQSSLVLASRQGSLVNKSMAFMDPLVTLFGSVHEKLPESGSMIFPNFGSMFSTAEPHLKNEQWDEESQRGDDYASEAAGVDSDDNLHSPLISRQTTSMDKDIVPPPSHGSIFSVRRHSSLMQGNVEAVGNTGIGGGWQLAWKWSEKGEDGKEGGFKRIYLHQEDIPGSRRGSILSLPGGDVQAEGEFIQAAALVSQPALFSEDLKRQHPVGPAMVHPSETVSKTPVWSALLEPGVKHALIVGIGIQILQQVLNTSYIDFTSLLNIIFLLVSSEYKSKVGINLLVSCYVLIFTGPLPLISLAVQLLDARFK